MSATLRAKAFATGLSPSAEPTPALFTINQIPAITQQPASQTIYVGETASFSVQATGDALLSYQWFKNNIAINGATNASYTTPQAFLADQGAQFTVTVNSLLSTPVTSAPATLTVNPLPQPQLNVAAQILPTASITLDYPYPVSSFVWIFTPTNSAASTSGTNASAPSPPAQSISTNSPELDLSSHVLALGSIYIVTLQVYDLNNMMARSTSATLTLVQAGLSEAKVFPNPFRSARGDTTLTFTALAPGSTLKIFTVSGRWVATLHDSNGTAVWKLTTDSGDKVASGIYIYLITDNGGRKTHGKFAVIR